MSAGSAQTLTVNVADSAIGGTEDAIGTQATPRTLPASGLWCGRLSQVGQTRLVHLPGSRQSHLHRRHAGSG